MLPELAASPIIAMTTDYSCTRCYFTAYANGVKQLIDYTRILHKLMIDWAGPDFTITTEIRDAHAAARLRQAPRRPTETTRTSPDLQVQIMYLTTLVQQLLTLISIPISPFPM